MPLPAASLVKRPDMCSQLVSVICSDWGGWWHTVQGNLEEIEEKSGLVLTGCSISPGKKVRICCGNNQSKGTVETAYMTMHWDILSKFGSMESLNGLKGSSHP